MPKTPSDPKSEFEQAVADHQKEGMTRSQAFREVAVKQPKLHRDYLRQVNAGRPEAAKRIRD